jgi:sugar lactone lactonase YvrE
VALADGALAVSDAEGVVLFSEEGEMQGRLTEVSPGSPFVRPNGVAFANDGSLIISDTNQRRVVSMSTTGELFWVLGGEADESQLMGLPRGLSVADDGSILVADAFRFAIAQVTGDGEFVNRYGSRGDQPGSFEYPNDIDLRKDRAVVADKENNRVQVFRLDGILGDSGNP